MRQFAANHLQIYWGEYFYKPFVSADIKAEIGDTPPVFFRVVPYIPFSAVSYSRIFRFSANTPTAG
ncbi:hypothetical protein [Undibacterium sp. WLHG33]|uniref:hypothetical protein n=1 Tax=Undibacterium sp. WLHG33 TaxID=3412482 RepID=UPI003C2CFA73